MLDDLKFRYKALALWKRLGLCLLLGILPAAYLYFDESGSLEEEFTQAESAEKTAAQQLLAADNKLKNLEKTEAELNFTSEQLKKAETRLPDFVAADEILRQVGKSAKDSSVTIVNFKPEAEVVRGDEYKYVEMPIKMTFEAHEYSQLCSWLDTIAGLKSKIYLKSWSIQRSVNLEKDDGASGSRLPDSKSSLDEVAQAEQDARRPRENLRLTVAADFSVYRLALSHDVKADPTSPAPAIKPKKEGAKSPGAAPAGAEGAG